MLYIDIPKVDRDVAHIVMAMHVCSKCFICSRRMLQVFYLDVAYTCMLQAYVSSVFRCFMRMFASVLSGCWFAIVFKCFQAFSQLFQTLVLSVLFVFFCMLQLLHLDVSKVHRMLHMRCEWEVAGGVDDVQGGASPLLVRSLVSSMC